MNFEAKRKKKKAETGNLDLEDFNKTEMDNFD